MKIWFPNATILRGLERRSKWLLIRSRRPSKRRKDNSTLDRLLKATTQLKGRFTGGLIYVGMVSFSFKGRKIRQANGMDDSS